MFDLEQSIADWRKQMLAAGIETPVPLEELESHLREEVEQQMKSGSDETQAFNSAIQKIGQAQVVQNEFRKVDGTGREREWKYTQILLLAFSSVFPLAMGGQMLYFQTGSSADMTPGQRLSGLAALVIFSLLAWGGRLGCGLFPAIPARRIRNTVINSFGVLMALWWIVLFNLILPHYDFTMGQLLVTILWGFIASAGAFIGLILGIENAARRKTAMP